MTDVFKVYHINLLTILTCFYIVIQITPGSLQDLNVSRPIQVPEIININGSETISNSGENLELICRGFANISWKYPDVDQNNEGKPWSETYISYSFDQNTDQYESKLLVTNISYMHTGSYKCEYQSSEVVESTDVYVYVPDEEHLFLPQLETFLVGHQFQNVTIPCRPTSPLVQVELKRNGKLLNVPFDRQKGFKFIVLDPIQLQYQCVAKNGTREDKLHYVVNVLPQTKKAPTPTITDESEAHYIGRQLKLTCTVKHDKQVLILVSFIPPPNVNLSDSRLHVGETAIHKGRIVITTKTIILSNLSVDDSGTYVCSVLDHAQNKVNKTIDILVHDEPYINLKSDVTKDIIRSVGQEVRIIVNVDAYPPVKYEWFFNNNEITSNYMYSVTNTPKRSKLVIQSAKITDDGQYMLRATNEGGFTTINFTLNVPEKPCVSVDGLSYILLNKKNQFSCTAVGNPIPEIRWSFKECLKNDECPITPISNDTQDISDNLLSVTSRLTLNKTVSGTLYCEGKNNVGKDFNLKEVVITDVHDGDVNDGFNVWQSIEPASVGDSIVLYCGSSKHNFTGPLVWYLNDSETPITSNANFEMVNITTLYSYQWNILIKNLTKEYNGNYRCDEGSRSSTLTLNVIEPKLPVIYDSNLKGLETKINQGMHLRLYCRARGIPTPIITWKKNNAPWIPDPKRIKIYNNNETVLFNFTIKEDEGKYSCEVSNRLDTQVRSSMLVINDGKVVITKKVAPWMIIVPILLIIALIIAIAFLFIKLRNEKRRIAEFENAGLDHFDEGDVECINPDLAIDDQADLLPYYNEWEFPRDKLKLGKVLGAGAFGVVMKAEAHGILDGEDSTTVAVKMVKRNADITYVKALASELKIMVHLGRHVNVANLLGACTKNLVSKRELCVIVEYCKYGNLLNYLQRHRRDFVNQIDPSTGDINTSIGADLLTRSGSMSPNRTRFASTSIFNRRNSSISASSKPIRSGGADYRAESEVSNSRNSNENTCNTEITVVSLSPEEEDVTTLSNNSTQQPEWRSNYQGDYRGNVAPMCSQDLLCYAFQVARGMDYLVSRHVLHGDLAARNVLLADHNVVKICDFGLAKSMYKDANYVKKKNSPLPIKWMALESIRDRIFSVQSDVWSYGIVLWEFFSLGQTPYPGMKVDETFYHKLEDGYRLSKPEFATKELYQLMLQCWEARPKGRPSFEKLADDIGTMLENAVREHYINLNSPYLIMNDMKNKDHSDYLAMMSSPDFENFASSNYYINELPTAIPLKPTIVQDNPSATNTGYLCMRPTSALINFDNPKKTDKSQKDVTSPEMLPMLNLNNSPNSTKSDIESDSELSTPDFKNINKNMKSFFNPTYQTPAGSISTSPSISDTKTNDIVTTKENYVNMPGQKNIINDKIKQKPVVSTDLGKNLDDQRIYVNDNITDHWIR